MKAIKFSKKINLEKLKTQHTIGKTPSKVFESAWYVLFFGKINCIILFKINKISNLMNTVTKIEFY